MAEGTVEFYAEIKWESPGAYLVTDGVDEFWIPKSQIIEMRKMKDGNCEFEIPHWLAREKGVI